MLHLSASGINIMVAIPGVASFAPDENYNFDKFIYDEIRDTYTCPQNQILITNGNAYQKSKRRNYYTVKHYKTAACATCPTLASCTKNKKGRLIERSEYQPYIEINKQNIEADPTIYKQRQSIVEHPYGTIKRQWGFYYVITKKGMKRASADVGFMFIAYNLRRMMNLLDKDVFKKFLKELRFLFFEKTASIKVIIFKLRRFIFYKTRSQNISHAA